jgi:large-conductance mechanosensitive channel
MATGAPQKTQNRQNGSSGYGVSANSVDVGLSTIAQMARDDTTWFVTGTVVASSLVFLILPLAVLIFVDIRKNEEDREARTRAIEHRVDAKIKKLEKLEKELQEQKEK